MGRGHHHSTVLPTFLLSWSRYTRMTGDCSHELLVSSTPPQTPKRRHRTSHPWEPDVWEGNERRSWIRTVAHAPSWALLFSCRLGSPPLFPFRVGRPSPRQCPNQKDASPAFALSLPAPSRDAVRPSKPWSDLFQWMVSFPCLVPIPTVGRTTQRPVGIPVSKPKLGIPHTGCVARVEGSKRPRRCDSFRRAGGARGEVPRARRDGIPCPALTGKGTDGETGRW